MTSKQNIELRKKLDRCYVWNITLYGSETWKLRKLKWKYLESFQMCCWRRMEKIKWLDEVTNEQVLEHIEEKRTLLFLCYPYYGTFLFTRCLFDENKSAMSGALTWLKVPTLLFTSSASD